MMVDLLIPYFSGAIDCEDHCTTGLMNYVTKNIDSNHIVESKKQNKKDTGDVEC